MALLRRLMPASWFAGKAEETNATTSSSTAKRAEPPTSVRKKSSRASLRLKKADNGNKLTVDMHEDNSATSNEIDCIDIDNVEIIKLSEKQKDILKTTWATIYAELGQSLCYVGKRDEAQKASGGVEDTFLRLFEEYPMSQQFFGDFRGTPVEALRNDARLSNALQEHAVRVLRVVEKVIGRLEDLEKVSGDVSKIHFRSLKLASLKSSSRTQSVRVILQSLTGLLSIKALAVVESLKLHRLKGFLVSFSTSFRNDRNHSLYSLLSPEFLKQIPYYENNLLLRHMTDETRLYDLSTTKELGILS